MIRIFKEQKTQTLPKDALEDFGEILFGEFRKKDEPDTDYEDRIFNMVYKWVDGDFMDSDLLSNDEKEVFRRFNKLKELYPDVLKPDSTKDIYRAVSAEDVIEFGEAEFDKDDFVFLDTRGIKWYSIQRPYYPYKEVESWTYGFYEALEFAHGMVKAPRFIVKEPKAETDDLLFDIDFINQVSSSIHGGEENEIVRIGKEPIESAVYYVSDDDYNKLIEKGLL